MTDGALFDLAPPKPAKPDNPAYRLGRDTAQRFRDERLAEFRRHQYACDQCRTAADRADEKGVKSWTELCLDGLLIFRSFARLQYGLERGYYPDHDRRKPAPRALADEHPALFDVDAADA